MSKVAYLDCPTGIAGDMCLGALVDLGVPLSYLSDQLARLGLSHEYRLSAESVNRNGQQATKVHVEVLINQPHPTGTGAAASNDGLSLAESSIDRGEASHSHPHGSHLPTPASHSQPATAEQAQAPTDPTTPMTIVRRLPDIEHLIQAAQLPQRAANWSLSIFRQLAVAEGAVHGVPADQVHFHEVGATDALVDVVGTCLGLDWLGIEQLYCSALPVGGGTIWAAHGRLPVPAPAVLRLLEQRQVPIYSNGIERELVTPTGAAIATTLVTQFGPPPAMVLQRVGLGAGSRNLPIANILRLWVGEQTAPNGFHQTVAQARSIAPSSAAPGAQTPTHANSHDQVTLLETQIDDLTPQAIGYVMEELFAAGALDVFTQAIAMKKSRPGILLTVICRPEASAACTAILFRETTTLGIRQQVQERQILQRAIQTVQTPLGPIRVKVAWIQDAAQPTTVQPEYEDCAQAARQHHRPWRDVHQQALAAWYQQAEPQPSVGSAN